MKTLSLLLTVFLALVSNPAQAQATTPQGSAASAPLPSASAPATKPARRALTAEEQKHSATFPNDLLPEGPTKPQIKVPLGKKPPAPSEAVASAVREDIAASPSKVNDQVARCKGQPNAQARAACARELAASDSGQPGR